MAGVSLSAKVIKPKRLQIDAIRLEILNELRKEGTEHKKLLQQTVSTWKGEKPAFETLIGLDKSNAIVITGPVGSTEAVNKFRWLDEGTKIRWAVMSPDWKSKTSVGAFKAGNGRGRVLIAGRRAMTRRGIRPRPGIKARGWTAKITKQRKVPFRRNLIAAMNRAASKAYS